MKYYYSTEATGLDNVMYVEFQETDKEATGLVEDMPVEWAEKIAVLMTLDYDQHIEGIGWKSIFEDVYLVCINTTK